MRSALFESILRERYVPIELGVGLNGQGREEKMVFNMETERPLSVHLRGLLAAMEKKPEWEHAEIDESDGMEITYEFANDAYKGNCRAFLILYEEDPIGLIKFNLDDHVWPDVLKRIDGLDNVYEHVAEIILLGFKQNNITLVRDVLSLFDKMIEEYGLVTWSVHNDNPIKKAYDRILPRFEGTSYRNSGGMTKYLVVGNELKGRLLHE